MDVIIKQEVIEPSQLSPVGNSSSQEIISLSSSSSEYSVSPDEDSDMDGYPKKKPRIQDVLPVGFLDPLRPEERLALEKRISAPPCTDSSNGVDSRNNGVTAVNVVASKVLLDCGVTEKQETVGAVSVTQSCKQFWKAGDYEAGDSSASVSQTTGMDHARVHPRFLHSNATSHKWALGAFAELLDNALDEVCNGATYVHVDVLDNTKDNNKMLLIEDNGGGMAPDKMRQCMSLGYSAKSKMANTIGQYGNGFKTSTMRLGADVIVFSRCKGKAGRSATQSIGLLSYTFLRETGKEDIVVPMICYEKMGENWNRLVGSSFDIWQRNLETIVQWCPYESEADLLQQFDRMDEQGTRIMIYNLWEDDQGGLELDFDTDHHDIQIGGASRDEKKIEMARRYPNSRHFLTYQYSLRSYASILYLRIPPGFRVILRGKEIQHHNIIDDMMHVKEITYRPNLSADMAPSNLNMVALVKIGFVKDATHHIDVQGFNVYHKNRLIRPFWRVWNAAGSDGRGVIGVLEANFVEPAHDKQGFEKTTVLARLETRLVAYQKKYWSTNCQLIGYAQRRRRSKKPVSPEKEASNPRYGSKLYVEENTTSPSASVLRPHRPTANVSGTSQSGARNHSNPSTYCPNPQSQCASDQGVEKLQVKEEMNGDENGSFPDIRHTILKLKVENHNLRNSLKNVEQDLLYEKDKNKSLENQLVDVKQKMIQMDQEQESFVISFSEERSRRDLEEEKLRRKLKDASETIEGLLRKVKTLETRRVFN